MSYSVLETEKFLKDLKRDFDINLKKMVDDGDLIQAYDGITYVEIFNDKEIFTRIQNYADSVFSEHIRPSIVNSIDLAKIRESLDDIVFGTVASSSRNFLPSDSVERTQEPDFDLENSYWSGVFGYQYCQSLIAYTILEAYYKTIDNHTKGDNPVATSNSLHMAFKQPYRDKWIEFWGVLKSDGLQAITDGNQLNPNKKRYSPIITIGLWLTYLMKKEAIESYSMPHYSKLIRDEFGIILTPRSLSRVPRNIDRYNEIKATLHKRIDQLIKE